MIERKLVFTLQSMMVVDTNPFWKMVQFVDGTQIVIAVLGSKAKFPDRLANSGEFINIPVRTRKIPVENIEPMGNEKG